MDTKLTKIEKFVIRWLLITPRLQTVTNKLNASRLHTYATIQTVERIIISVYRKLGISSRLELLAMQDEFQDEPLLTN